MKFKTLMIVVPRLKIISPLVQIKVQFGQESCPAGEYHHSERLWMLEKVSAALKTTPTTIPQTPHISKNPQKKIILAKVLRVSDEH